MISRFRVAIRAYSWLTSESEVIETASRRTWIFTIPASAIVAMPVFLSVSSSQNRMRRAHGQAEEQLSQGAIWRLQEKLRHSQSPILLRLRVLIEGENSACLAAL